MRRGRPWCVIITSHDAKVEKYRIRSSCSIELQTDMVDIYVYTLHIFITYVTWHGGNALFVATFFPLVRDSFSQRVYSREFDIKSEILIEILRLWRKKISGNRLLINFVQTTGAHKIATLLLVWRPSLTKHAFHCVRAAAYGWRVIITSRDVKTEGYRIAPLAQSTPNRYSIYIHYIYTLHTFIHA